ncbi:MAG: hypothetical protein H6600_02190 [Flavobacteriales bacterium]|nr:hypothetical protein [Flavobacteriales bacterium]MCB9197241.1 hypothetical protein [Flavobacteriales bacterium]
MSLSELVELLNLDYYESLHPTPEYGSGINVVEMITPRSWGALLAALEDLNDDKLRTVCQDPISIIFHNNVSNRFAEAGAMWTIKEFIEHHGGKTLRDRVKRIVRNSI